MIKAVLAGRWKGYAGAVGGVALITVGCLLLRSRLQIADIAMLFLLAVIFAATRWHRGPALTATVLAIATFDFGFVPPYYTFNVTDKAYFLTFTVMFAVALVMGSLTARIRDQAEEATERERRTAAAHRLTRELGEATGRADQLPIITRHLVSALGGEAAVAVVGNPSAPKALPRWPLDELFERVEVRVAAAWGWEHGEPAGAGTDQCTEAEACIVPLRSNAGAGTLAVIVVRPGSRRPVPDASAWRTAMTLAEHASAALERTDLAELHEQARIEVEAERLRTALLSSLSHDLRTPLGTIEGAASGLLHEGAAISTEARNELAETIVHESQRMTRLVGNLLDMVRVETGGLAVKKEWQPLEESLGVSLLRLEDQLRGHPVETHLPNDLSLVPIDELLIEQVFLNLLENAIKYTPPGTPIAVSAWAENDTVVVEVADRGPGVSPGQEREVFRKFHRAAAAGPVGGAGLGLTICEGIITAHGGRIWVESAGGTGAAFRFTLPLDGPPLGMALTDVAGD